jgi:mannitol/fructose-specific phosphotransferase system IIA component
MQSQNTQLEQRVASLEELVSALASQLIAYGAVDDDFAIKRTLHLGELLAA